MDEYDQETGSKTKDSGTRKNRSLNRCVFGTPDPHKVSAVGGGTSLPPSPSLVQMFMGSFSKVRQQLQRKGEGGGGAAQVPLSSDAPPPPPPLSAVKMFGPPHLTTPLSLSSTQPHPAKALSRNNGDKGPRVLQRHKPRPPPPPCGAPAPS